MKGPATAVPRAGNTLATTLGPWAHRVLDSYHALLAETEQPDFDKNAAVRLYADRYSPVELCWETSDEQVLALAAAGLLSTFLTALAAGRPAATLTDSEAWFFGGEPVLARLRWTASFEVTDPLASLVAEGDLIPDVLPHVFEVFVTGPIGGSRSAHLSRRNNRGAKRRSGVFYTPADVAEHVCTSAVNLWRKDSADNIPNVLDPSCGTGSFLLAALKVLNATYSPSPENLRHVHGIDIDPAAVQAARFSIVAAQSRHLPLATPAENVPLHEEQFPGRGRTNDLS